MIAKEKAPDGGNVGGLVASVFAGRMDTAKYSSNRRNRNTPTRSGGYARGADGRRRLLHLPGPLSDYSARLARLVGDLHRFDAHAGARRQPGHDGVSEPNWTSLGDAANSVIKGVARALEGGVNG